MDEIAVPERHPLRVAGLVAGGTVLVLVLAAGVLYLWLRTYAPLSTAGSGVFAAGPGIGRIADPTAGSGGKPVFIPAYRPGRPFDTSFTLHNTGRFAVEVIGLAGRGGLAQLRPAMLFATDSATASAEPAHLHPFKRLRLERGDEAIVVVRWQLDCSQSESGIASAASVPLRYSYLSLFTRTEPVELPFEVTLRCP